MARPLKPIDWDQVKTLCGFQCTQVEIAAVQKISVERLDERCKIEQGVSLSEFMKLYVEAGKASLRRKMYEVAMRGNTTMLIHGAKHYLGQTDKSTVEHDVSDKLESLIASSYKGEGEK